MRFDWYQATINSDPIPLVETLKAELAPTGEVTQGRGLHGYQQRFMVRDSKGDVVANVLAGGKNGNPNAWASGDATDEFVRVVRASWQHRVTRLDTAEDMAQEGAYESLEAVCRGLAKEKGLKGRSILPDDPADGRTYYIGSPSSDVMVRLYDKTAERRRELPPERHGEVPDHWARLEARIRPRREGKFIASMVSASDAWGFAGWSSELAERAFALQVQRITMQAGRESDHDRAYRFMLKQYSNVLRQMYRDLGSWECVGLTIGGDMRRLDSLK